MSDEIKEFIKLIVEDFEIEEETLLQLWEMRSRQSANSGQVDFSSQSVASLKAMCKEKGLKVGGSKKDLIQRLTESLTQTQLPIPPPPKRKRTPPKKKPVILHNLENNIEKIHIRRNTFGYYEHPETGFIFDEKTHRVIGKQSEVLDPHKSNHTIEPLTEEDIEKCKELRFEYTLPDTL